MGKRRSLTPSENSYMRDHVRALVIQMGTQAAVAEALGMNAGALSMFLAGRSGTSDAVADRVAEITGKDKSTILGSPNSGYQEIRELADRDFESSPGPSQRYMGVLGGFAEACWKLAKRLNEAAKSLEKEPTLENADKVSRLAHAIHLLVEWLQLTYILPPRAVHAPSLPPSDEALQEALSNFMLSGTIAATATGLYSFKGPPEITKIVRAAASGLATSLCVPIDRKAVANRSWAEILEAIGDTHGTT